MNPNTRSQSGQKLFLYVMGVLVCIPFVIAACRIVTWPGIFPSVEPKKFDTAQLKAWTITDMRQTEDIRREFGRRDMFADLLATQNLKGMTAEQLNQLLGEPTPEFLPIESDWGKWDLAYLVGPDFVDYEVLVFRLDEDGLVESFQVVDL